MQNRVAKLVIKIVEVLRDIAQSTMDEIGEMSSKSGILIKIVSLFAMLVVSILGLILQLATVLTFYIVTPVLLFYVGWNWTNSIHGQDLVTVKTVLGVWCVGAVLGTAVKIIVDWIRK
jgi:uncharacterized membrane protein